MSQDQIDSFIAITSAENDELARHFIEMAGGDLQTAIALFFEHGGNSQLRRQAGDSGQTGTDFGGNNDEDVAHRLQAEAYRNEEEFVRAPDQARHETLAETHIFPGTYGGIGGSFNPLRQARDMFDDARPAGVFNQRLDDDFIADGSDSESDSDDSATSSEDDDAYEYVEEPVIELDEDGNVREYTKLVKRPKAMSRERRLALLFRPPFDLMTKLNLNSAKEKARRKNKWLLVNIQDSGVFQCQALNRDLWSSKDVKKLIKTNFVFLQYQYDSPNAQPYVNFYGIQGKDSLPHIAILDPMTGERLKQWNKTVPMPENFIKEVNEFLGSFSLDPKTANPTVKEPTPEIDPTTLSEEQQMKLAIEQSLGKSNLEPIALDEPEHNAKDNHVVSAFDAIKAVKHEEPPNRPGITTRIQVRTGDGRRIVRRFETHDLVRNIYEFIKSEIDGFEECHFTLSNHQREDLIDKLDMSIEDAGLKNSSLLVEKAYASD
ncbi:hypothetical protein HG537_0E02670 [Torulaspora globosa]|uniref:UBX domain-containing protein n=1 Tax=Torulaspora globosa TaxID=48254 RepID=A0A7H9HX06_9SACH|nr:hypothetical protein HG537_0E02670 [Torulaspora sp. CBS 2947]